MTNTIMNVRAKQGKFTFRNEGTAKLVFTLPPAARILRFYVDVTEAFDDTGTDILELGTVTDPDRFASGVVLSTVAWLEPTALHNGQQADHPIDVLATYTGQNNNAAAGAATVICEYATLFD